MQAGAYQKHIPQRMRMLLQGRVQGVGMRPFVCRLAQELGLNGWVNNTPQGVIIEAEGPAATLALFAGRLPQELPPQARLSACTTTTIPAAGSEQGFHIQHSHTSGAPSLDAPPDLAACPACLSELFDPGDRRHRYPFLSCSHCGPRYSILRALPFDRERTSMAAFPLCAACLAEYQNPADRRFHAQTVCCPDCGPRLALWDADGHPQASRETALAQAVAQLRAGRILALKGVGGFQLLADAANQAALLELRRRKHRPHKPFAVLVDVPMTRGLCHVDDDEMNLLVDPAAPIVLLRRLPQAGVAEAVAPALPWLGLMLPASPLHHLLLRDFGAPLVATSGNLGGEPIAIDEQEALTRLNGIADGYLLHDRAILRPLDDSLLRMAARRPLLLRRARGYAPSPIALAEPLPPVLAVGGHLKNTVGLAHGRSAVLSQHLGDLDDALSLSQCRDTLLELPRFYGVQARAVACDAHPDYAGH
ncbi:MAG: carbamoyltransferase HypF, partial [Methylococcaceae bacterium]